MPMREVGIPIAVKAPIERRIESRILRPATTGPYFDRKRAEKYVSGTRCAYFAVSRHQAAASSLAVYGFLEMSRNGRAPRSASVRTNASTFARYCAVDGDQGVSRSEPKSSLSAICGVAHFVCAAAKSKSLFAFPAIVAGSAGAVGRPTRSRFRYMSQ